MFREKRGFSESDLRKANLDEGTDADRSDFSGALLEQAVAIDPAEHYDAWAETYEADLLGDYGYCAHRIAATAFRSLVPGLEAEIIDVGCGTPVGWSAFHSPMAPNAPPSKPARTPGRSWPYP